MAAASSDRVDKLLTHLYGAAEVLIESIADPDIIDAAPLNHRSQALDAVSRFIQRLKKVNAASQRAQQAQEEHVWDPNEPVCYLDITPVESMLTEEDFQHIMALELELPGRFSNYRSLRNRLANLRRSDPAALNRLDPDRAREYFANSHVAMYESLQTVPPGVKPTGRQYAIS